MTSPQLSCRPLSPDNFSDFVSVFRTLDSPEGCFCLNHRLRPEEEDLVGEPALARMQSLVGTPRLSGILGFIDGAPAGWCGIDPHAEIQNHDCFEVERAKVWSIHCLLVLPAFRGLGLSRAMTQAAIELAKSKGANSVEVYARGAPRFHEFLPRAPLFQDLGFEEEACPDPYYSRWVQAIPV